MLHLADILLTVVHMCIVLFNLFGWIPKAIRKAHFVSILLTAGSWLVLGIWFGAGYCPFTDWQWGVKAQLGEQNLPPNFIEYFAERLTNHNFDSGFITTVIAVCFAAAALLSLYVNFVLPRYKHTSPFKRA